MNDARHPPSVVSRGEWRISVSYKVLGKILRLRDLIAVPSSASHPAADTLMNGRCQRSRDDRCNDGVTRLCPVIDRFTRGDGGGEKTKNNQSTTRAIGAFPCSTRRRRISRGTTTFGRPQTTADLTDQRPEQLAPPGRVRCPKVRKIRTIVLTGCGAESTVVVAIGFCVAIVRSGIALGFTCNYFLCFLLETVSPYC